jgi:hypothetical protein
MRWSVGSARLAYVRPSSSQNSISKTPDARSSTTVPTCPCQRFLSGRSTVRATTASRVGLFFIPYSSPKAYNNSAPKQQRNFTRCSLAENLPPMRLPDRQAQVYGKIRNDALASLANNNKSSCRSFKRLATSLVEQFPSLIQIILGGCPRSMLRW